MRTWAWGAVLCVSFGCAQSDGGARDDGAAPPTELARDGGTAPDLAPPPPPDLAQSPDLAPVPDLAPRPDLAPAINPVSLCPVDTMDQDYPGALPPNPYGSFPEATDCMLQRPYDVIVLLGCPNNSDGTPASCQLKRVDIGMALMDAKRGDRFIVSGAAAHNQYVEADTLASLLVARGVPPEHIWKDVKAMHTDENIYYSTKIMEAQGWTNALMVSDDPGHLVMTAVCDSNCCVDLGRLTVVEFQLSLGWTKVGHYVRYPWASMVSGAECSDIEQPLKFMCTNLSSRLACAADFKL